MNTVRFTVLLCLLLSSGKTWAERKALLIGNADYRGKKADLANPVRDVRLLSTVLQEAGFRTTVIKNATESKLKDALNKFAENLSARDDAFVYYSGHGIAIEGKNYLLGVRFNATNPVDALARHSDIYPVNQLVKRLEITGARLRVVVIDACRAEPFTKARGWQTSKTSEDTYKGFEPVARTPVGKGTLVAFAAAGKEQASDLFSNKVKNGPYAYALSQQIRTPGADILHVFTDLGEQVRGLTKNKQSPEFLSNLRGRFYFTAPIQIQPKPSKERSTVTPRTPKGMVQVPGGRFFMGCNEKVDKECNDDEKPGRTVSVKTFFIDRTEVTVEAYTECVKAGECSDYHLTGIEWKDVPGWNDKLFTKSEHCNLGKRGRKKHPINCVDWNQASEFCAWKGKRLPTEAEWEKAARGTDGRKYPWGNQQVTCDYAILNDGGDGCGRISTWPVGSKPAGKSPYGALDMVGNVWEWTDSWLDESERKYRVIRGGAWSNVRAFARASLRYGYIPGNRRFNVGFRCARAAD